MPEGEAGRVHGAPSTRQTPPRLGLSQGRRKSLKRRDPRRHSDVPRRSDVPGRPRPRPGCLLSSETGVLGWACVSCLLLEPSCWSLRAWSVASEQGLHAVLKRIPGSLLSKHLPLPLIGEEYLSHPFDHLSRCCCQLTQRRGPSLRGAVQSGSVHSRGRGAVTVNPSHARGQRERAAAPHLAAQPRARCNYRLACRPGLLRVHP